MPDPSAAARLVEAFANTVDVELGTDELAEPDDLGAWLRDQGLLGEDAPVGAADHDDALRLRDGIRERLGLHVGDEPRAGLLAAANNVLRRLPVLVVVDGDAVLAAEPGLSPVRRALAALGLAWAELVITGDATRLKRCAEHSCAWVFWDTSKNRSRRWCSMRVCGNRNKARRFAARRRSAEPES
ncbi:CGNR zinc finger domain-containing protein [Streptoalloteichus hindustanus]|uniref:Conserved protein containing a Zn-ribbon-like motif, possibly RNA-binding n=1 Tax=Streptoalloteichus hindustanus TaxID=2017 RepID=A0A1M5IDK9_STRHI|nr:CGNR zinc finger domain-containing protein [Streptoalloteichus hindustanus]SHG26352.1 Conserved protein containing a Zn-ribbon-like motif, possibly RNA-binding [Streptoalloteichus hindustanus]